MKKDSNHSFKSRKRAGCLRLAAVLLLSSTAAAQAGPELPALNDELLGQAGAALHVDVQTGRVVGITDSGPKAEIGAKIVEVILGDYAAGEWTSYLQSVEGEYVKPAVSQRLILIPREGRGLLLDEEFSPGKREELVRKLGDYRRQRELLTEDRHVPDYLLRSESNILLHVVVEKTETYERGRGYLSANHTAKVRAVIQGNFKPGQTVVLNEDSNNKKRIGPPANPERIVMLSESRSLKDGQMKLFLNDKVNYGYTEGGLKTLKADVARVRAEQAAKK